jgi:hypothetical protein
MPNGGFGCAFCIHLTEDLCRLRKSTITQTASTVCETVADRKNTIRLPRATMADWEKTEPSGSIYAITGSEGAYMQVPWLETSEIFEDHQGPNNCDYCAIEVESARAIQWSGRWHYFCTFKHYLIWRNEFIDSGQAQDDPYEPKNIDRYFRDYTDLQIVKQVSTAESRKRSNDIARNRRNAKIVGFFVIIGLLIAGVWSLL